MRNVSSYGSIHLVPSGSYTSLEVFNKGWVRVAEIRSYSTT